MADHGANIPHRVHVPSPAPPVDHHDVWLPGTEVLLLGMPCVYLCLFLIFYIDPTRARVTFIEWLRRAHIRELLQSSSAYKDLEEFGDLERNECVLCLEPFEPGAQVLTLPCKHAYHTKCIHRWLSFTIFQTRRCPTCKRDALHDGVLTCKGLVSGASRACLPSAGKAGGDCLGGITRQHDGGDLSGRRSGGESSGGQDDGGDNDAGEVLAAATAAAPSGGNETGHPVHEGGADSFCPPTVAVGHAVLA